MAVGTITSILAGVTFPFFLMYFGQITDIFTFLDTAAEKGLHIMYEFLLIGSVYWVLSNACNYLSLHSSVLLELLRLDPIDATEKDIQRAGKNVHQGRVRNPPDEQCHKANMG